MEETEITISLKDIFRVLKKNMIFIILMVLIFSACAFFVTKFFITKKYTSNISLYVDTNYSSTDIYNSGSNDLNSYNYAQKLVATYIKMLNTKTFYSKVAEKLDNKYTASEIEGMVSFKSDEETEIFQASIVSISPSEAKYIADAVSEVAPTVISHLNNNATLKIVDEADIPQTYSSPSMTKNILVAFMAGLVFALIIAFLRDYFDVKIKYDSDMTTLEGVPVLTAIPDFEYFAGKAESFENIMENSSASAEIKN